MCHAESRFVSSTSRCCSIECFRNLRQARICVSPQRDGWGRLRGCHRGGGRRRRKQGAGDGAPSRRARFDGAVRRVHMATWRDRIIGCVGAWRVLPRRKRRPWPRTPVHKGPLRLPRRRPGLALPGVARGAAEGKAAVLVRLRQRGPHIKREARRRKRRARGRAERTKSCGRPRGSAFVSSDQPSGGRSRRVGRKSSGPPSRRIRSQASKRRRRGSHCEPDAMRSSGGRRRSDAPHWKEVLPEPEPKAIELPASRPRKKRQSIETTSCLSGERVSERPRGTGLRPVSKAQDAYDSRGKDHAASDAPGGSQLQAKPKAKQENNEETENDIIVSELDGKWCEFGRGVRGSESRAKQRRCRSIEAVPRGALQVLSPDHWKPSGDDGRHPGSTGRSTAAGISTRFGHEVLRQDYNEEILRSEHQCRDESIGGGDGLIDGWPCEARGRHHGPEVPSPRVRSHRRGIVEQSEALGTGPIGRSHVSHPRTARRHESPGAPRSTVDRETNQLELKRARSECQSTGREWRHQGRNLVEIARREPVREKKQKGEQDLGEHRTDSWQQRVTGWEETQTGVGTCCESGKGQTLNEEPPVTRLRLRPRRGWLRDLPAKGPLPQHGVYIGRSHDAFYQPQGWGNPFKPDPRMGKQRRAGRLRAAPELVLVFG